MAFINAFIEFYQLQKSEAILASFLAMIPPSCRVVRDATLTSIPAADLVKGDIVLVVSNGILMNGSSTDSSREFFVSVLATRLPQIWFYLPLPTSRLITVVLRESLNRKNGGRSRMGTTHVLLRRRIWFVP